METSSHIPFKEELMLIEWLLSCNEFVCFFTVGFKGALFRLSGLLRSPYHYMLIITPANLFCSMHTQMNINAKEDDSRACERAA